MVGALFMAGCVTEVIHVYPPGTEDAAGEIDAEQADADEDADSAPMAWSP